MALQAPHKASGHRSEHLSRHSSRRRQITENCPDKSIPQADGTRPPHAPKAKPLPPDFRRLGDTLPGLLEQLAERRRRYQEEHAREGVTQ